MSNKENTSKFCICRHCGFQITFDNGYTVSVQFGPGHYCENYDRDFMEPSAANYWKSGNAEVAVLDDNWDFVTRNVIDDGDDVLPSVTPNELAKIIATVSAWPAQKE